jgi:membrane fusion protein, multidrug efflux system
MREMNMKQTAAVGVVLAIISILFWTAACNSEPKEKPKEDIVPVKTAAVKLQRMAVPIYSSGQLYPKTMIKMSFKVGGIVEKIRVEEGQSVKKGQLLATLDLAEIKARHSQAKNGWLKAKRDLERVKNLYKDRAATLEQLQNVETAYEVAESDLKIAGFNLQHSRIEAPASGKILKKTAEEGELLGAGTPVLIFGSTENRWIIKVGLSEKDIVRLALRDSAKVRFDAYPNEEFDAEVTEISNALDPASGTYEVELSLLDGAEEGRKMAAGFVGRVTIEPSVRESFYIIPVDSIVEGEGDQGIVFTVKEDRAIRLKIKVAHIFPETAAVRMGLEGVKKVVTNGAAYLRDGSRVDIKADTGGENRR